MEFRVGLIPRPLRSVTKGSPQIYRHAAFVEMTRERDEAARTEVARTEVARAEAARAEAARAKAVRASIVPSPLAREGQAEGSKRLARPFDNRTTSNRSEQAGRAKTRTRTRAKAARSISLGEKERMGLSILRRLAEARDLWRVCPARVCRRARRCASPALACSAIASRQRSPAQQELALAQFKRAIGRRLKEHAGPNSPDAHLHRRER